jgi:hypothetical protein
MSRTTWDFSCSMIRAKRPSAMPAIVASILSEAQGKLRSWTVKLVGQRHLMPASSGLVPVGQRLTARGMPPHPQLFRPFFRCRRFAAAAEKGTNSWWFVPFSCQSLLRRSKPGGGMVAPTVAELVPQDKICLPTRSGSKTESNQKIIGMSIAKNFWEVECELEPWRLKNVTRLQIYKRS